MVDDMKTRRRNAAAAFIARRGDLSLTQEDVAARAGVVLRTVQNFEYGVWPNARTRALLEKALDWPAGEISRLASPPQAVIEPQLLDRIRELSGEQRAWLAGWLRSQTGNSGPDMSELQAVKERLAELQVQLHGMRGKADDEGSG